MKCSQQVTEGHLCIISALCCSCFACTKHVLRFQRVLGGFHTENAHTIWIKLGLGSFKSTKFRRVSEILKSFPPTQSWGSVGTIKISFPDFPVMGAEGGAGLALMAPLLQSQFWCLNHSALGDFRAALEVFASSSSWGRRDPGSKLGIPKRAPRLEFKGRMTEQDVKTEMCKDTFLPPGNTSLFTKCQALNSSKQQHQPSTINWRKWLERIDFVPAFKWHFALSSLFSMPVSVPFSPLTFGHVLKG